MLRKHHRLRGARYPDGLTKDAYKELLLSKYSKENPEFTKEQIAAQIKQIVGYVLDPVDLFPSYNSKLAVISCLRGLLEGASVPDVIRKQRTLGMITGYLKGKEQVSEIILGRHKLPRPEKQHWDKYVRVNQAIAKEVVLGVCDATERFIHQMQGKENIDTFNKAPKNKPGKSVRFFFDASTNEPRPQRNKSEAKDSPVAKTHLTAEEPEQELSKEASRYLA